MTEEPPKTRFDHLRRDDSDGSREGGLGFLVTFLWGFVAGASFIPGGLTMFWVWMLILVASMAGGSICMGLARWNNNRKHRQPLSPAVRDL